jgi:hypothetical protein
MSNCKLSYNNIFQLVLIDFTDIKVYHTLCKYVNNWDVKWKEISIGWKHVFAKFFLIEK